MLPAPSTEPAVSALTTMSPAALIAGCGKTWVYLAIPVATPCSLTASTSTQSSLIGRIAGLPSIHRMPRDRFASSWPPMYRPVGSTAVAFARLIPGGGWRLRATQVRRSTTAGDDDGDGLATNDGRWGSPRAAASATGTATSPASTAAVVPATATYQRRRIRRSPSATTAVKSTRLGGGSALARNARMSVSSSMSVPSRAEHRVGHHPAKGGKPTGALALDVAGRAVQCVRGLLDRQVGDVPQHQHRALPLGQLTQRPSLSLGHHLVVTDHPGGCTVLCSSRAGSVRHVTGPLAGGDAV